jgi:hypothetical protein
VLNAFIKLFTQHVTVLVNDSGVLIRLITEIVISSNDVSEAGVVLRTEVNGEILLVRLLRSGVLHVISLEHLLTLVSVVPDRHGLDG